MTAECLTDWERMLAERGYRKHPRGRSQYSTGLYQRDVTRTGSSGLFFNFDRYDHDDIGTRLEGWMQIARADGRTIDVEQISFRPADLTAELLDAIEGEWLAIVKLAPVDEDQRV